VPGRPAVSENSSLQDYMLVFKKTPQGWKIVRDVTIPAPKP
jgi:ketosteroid isomerase-like protein